MGRRIVDAGQMKTRGARGLENEGYEVLLQTRLGGGLHGRRIGKRCETYGVEVRSKKRGRERGLARYGIELPLGSRLYSLWVLYCTDGTGWGSTSYVLYLRIISGGS